LLGSHGAQHQTGARHDLTIARASDNVRLITISGQARIPFNHTLTSTLGLGPIPFTQLIRAHELVGEANRCGSTRPAANGLSHTEDSIRTASEARANAWLAKQTRSQIVPEIAAIKGLHAEINHLQHQHDLADADGTSVSTGRP
jgi:hypothetical protein